MDDDFNSEDEVGDIRPPQKRQWGLTSIMSMKESAEEDRIHSKRRYLSLDVTKGSERTRRITETWENRLNAFRELINPMNPNVLSTPPTTEEIVRFIETIVRKLKPKHKHTDAVNASTIRRGIWHAFTALEFRYQSFKMDKQMATKTDSCIERLVQEGLLVKGWSSHRAWAGQYIVQKMAAAWLDDAINNGTLSWDLHLLKLCAVVMQSALGCRPGDLIGDHFNKHHYLKWSDITITVGNTFDDLYGEATLRFTKGHKNELNQARHISFTVNPKSNCACPIALIVILALRFGQIDPDITTCLETAQRQPSRAVLWKNPSQAFFPSVRTDKTLDFTQPCHTSIITNSLKQMYPLAGVTEHLTAMSLRRGFAHDLSRVPDLPPDNYSRVAAAVGHTGRDRGTTRLYIGDDDIAYNGSIAQSINGPARRDAPIGTYTASPLDFRVKTKEIIDYCQANGMDATVSAHRIRATKHVRRQKVAEFHERARESLHEVVSESSTVQPSTVQSSTIPSSTVQFRHENTLAYESHQNSTIQSADENTVHDDSFVAQFPPEIVPFDEIDVAQFQLHNDELNIIDSWIHSAGQSEQAQQPSITFEQMLDQDIDSWIHSAGQSEQGQQPSVTFEQMLDQDIDSWIHSAGQPEQGQQPQMLDLESSQPSAFEQDLITDIISPSCPSPSIRTEWQKFTLVEFINFFSAINETNSQTKVASQAISRIECGNSRAEPSVFQYRCDTVFDSADVCQYSTRSRELFRSHRQSCRPENQKEMKQRLFQCKECPMMFTSPRAVTIHIRNVHNWTPKACPEPGCTDFVYDDRPSFEQHHRRVHAPITCPHMECVGNGQTYTQRGSLRTHIKRVHKMTGDQIDSMMPNRKARPRTEQFACQRCSFTTKHRATLVKHLRCIHKLILADARVEAGLPADKRPPKGSK